jgi:hypothetical protein
MNRYQIALGMKPSKLFKSQPAKNFSASYQEKKDVVVGDGRFKVISDAQPELRLAPTGTSAVVGAHVVDLEEETEDVIGQEVESMHTGASLLIDDTASDSLFNSPEEKNMLERLWK